MYEVKRIIDNFKDNKFNKKDLNKYSKDDLKRIILLLLSNYIR